MPSLAEKRGVSNSLNPLPSLWKFGGLTPLKLIRLSFKRIGEDELSTRSAALRAAPGFRERVAQLQEALDHFELRTPKVASDAKKIAVQGGRREGSCNHLSPGVAVPTNRDMSHRRDE